MKTLVSKIIICTLLSALSLMSAANNMKPQTLDELKQAVEAIRTETGAPAIGIALVDKNGPIWVDGLGLSNLEESIPANADTIFRIGSVSKMFSGIAVMQLVSDGKLSLDDKLRDVAPHFEFENPWESSHPVLISHLLEHTTGWDVHLGEYAGEQPDSLSLEEGLQLHPDSRKSRWAPGTRQAYSNTGPVAAARVVEIITGQAFEAYVQEHIFEPLGMASSSYFKTDAYNERGAVSYTRRGPAEYLHIYSRPSSSLNTSPNDVASLLQFFIGRGRVNNTQVLSSAALDRMEKSETTLGAKAGIEAGYGLTIDAIGFENFNTVFYGHTGGVPGAITDLMYLPEEEIGYAFMINQENPQAFSRLSNLMKAYLLKDTEKKVGEAIPLPEKFKNLQGYYVSVNPLFELGRIVTDISSVMKFTAGDVYFHRSPFFGGWKSTDYAVNDKYLISDWTGLPSIAIVDDPEVGYSVQVEGVVYKRISPVLIYGRLVFLALIIATIVVTAGIAVLSFVRRLGKSKREASSIKTWAYALSCFVIALPIVFSMSGIDPKLIMQSVPLGILLYVLSVIYPVATLGGIYKLVGAYKVGIHGFVNNVAALAIVSHGLLSLYLAYYGFVGFNVWA